MGLFDKIKTVVVNAAEGFKADYDEAKEMDLYALCDAMKAMKLLDKKLLGYRQALHDRCDVMEDDELEEFYKYIKKSGSLLKEHPGKEAVEDVLVSRNMYVRHNDGSITKNSAYKWFK